MPIKELCHGCITPSACREGGFCWNSVVIQTRCDEQKKEALANPRPAVRIEPGSTGPTGAASDPLYTGASGPAAPGALVPPPAPAAPRQRAATGPRAPAGAGGRPAAGSATGKVWELADQARAGHGDRPLDKDFRRNVIKTCEAAGVNLSTASVQYSKWLASLA